MIDDLRQDLRYAIRTLRRERGFAAFAVIIIALGIGASVTVFSVANALLVRPLPFRNPGALVWIPNGEGTGLSQETTQVGHFLDFERENRSFSELGAYFAFYGVGDAKLTGTTDAVRLTVVPVSRHFFPVLGVVPILGRNFTPAECVFNGPRVVLLSHALWERRFASDPAIVGRAITLDDQSATVVGVLPASFDFGSVFAPGTNVDLFTPFPLTPETNRWGNTLSIVGRLEPGVTLANAAAELRVLAPQIEAAHPERNRFRPRPVTLREHVSGRIRPAIITLAFGVGVEMLIVCANLSNLLLARATTRQKEMAIRAALGAGRRRLVRQMLTESLLLSSVGAVVGFAIAMAGTRGIAHSSAVSLPLLAGVQIDTTALAFTLVLALGTGMAFGMAPALQLPDTAVHDALMTSSRTATAGVRGQLVRRALVVSEIALACVLLVGSGLLVRSFLKVLAVDLGFHPETVISLRVDPNQQQRSSANRVGTYFDDVLRLAKAVPGIRGAAVADGLPFGSNRSWGVRPKGQEYRKGELPPIAFVRMVSEGYVEAMGMRLRAGREFTADDAPSAERVMMVNETMAHTLWPNESAIGKMVDVDGTRRVVGVVADVRHLALEQDAGLEMYLPIRQTNDFGPVILVVRTSLPPASVAASLRRSLATVAPNVPMNAMRTMAQIVDMTVSPRRFFTALLGGFALFALVLALLGIYGVISYTVSHRTQEIGVRIAIGATATRIQRGILLETLEVAAAGMVLGTVAAWMLTRLLSGLLFGVTATDPVTFAGMLATITVVAAASGYVPARRASRIDPVTALRG